MGQNLSVRETEALVRGYHNRDEGGRKSTKNSRKLPDFAEEGLRELQQALEAEIKVVSNVDAWGGVRTISSSPK